MDFASLGGGSQTGCAPGDPATGIEALRGAGFEPTRAAQQAGYFVCRIDGKPADDPCQRASPSNAYWSYWHAAPGGTWSFSNTGPASYDPKPGTVEGWSFGAGEPPSTPPPTRERAERSPAATPSPAPARATPTPQRSSAPPQVAPAASPSQTPIATASTMPTVRDIVTPSAAGSTASSPSADAQREPMPLTANEPPTPRDEGNPLVGVLLAVGVVAGLGAAAAFRAQRRR